MEENPLKIRVFGPNDYSQVPRYIILTPNFKDGSILCAKSEGESGFRENYINIILFKSRVGAIYLGSVGVQ